MLIPRFWARATGSATAPDGRSIPIALWRGARSSPADAQAAATEAVGRMAARIQRGEGFPDKYAYGDRPLREEVVQELPGTGDDPSLAITRNSYGALVLNAAEAFFIDVDLPQDRSDAGGGASSSTSALPNPAAALLDSEIGRQVTEALPAPLKSLVQGLFGRASAPAASPPPAAPPPRPATPADGALARLRHYVAAHPGWGVRVYRTRAGLRYLVTHARFSPTAAETEQAMRELGADPQYVQLCRAQKSFRARLSPKPWRIQLRNPPASFPYEGPQQESAARAWQREYDAASARYATAAFVETVGSASVHAAVASALQLHDQQARATSGLPLA